MASVKAGIKVIVMAKPMKDGVVVILIGAKLHVSKIVADGAVADVVIGVAIHMFGVNVHGIIKIVIAAAIHLDDIIDEVIAIPNAEKLNV